MFPSKKAESGQSSPKSRTSASDMTIPMENMVSTALAEKETTKKRAKEFETAVKASIGQAGSRRARRGHKLTTLTPADPRLKSLYPEACALISEGSVERSPEDRQMTSASPRLETLLLSLSSPDQQRVINTPSELGRRCPIPPTSTSPNDLMRLSSISLPVTSVTPKVDEKDSTEDIEIRKEEKKSSPEILSSTMTEQGKYLDMDSDKERRSLATGGLSKQSQKLSRPGSSKSTTIQFEEEVSQFKHAAAKSSRASSASNSSSTSTVYREKHSRPTTAKSVRPSSVQDVSRGPSTESTTESRPVSVKSMRSPSTRDDMSRISSAKSEKELRPVSSNSTRTPSAKDMFRTPSSKSENMSRPVTGKSRTPSAKNIANVSRQVSAKSSCHDISRASSVVSEQESRPASAKPTKMLYSQVISRSSTPQSKQATRPVSSNSTRTPSAKDMFRTPSSKSENMSRPVTGKSRTPSAKNIANVSRQVSAKSSCHDISRASSVVSEQESQPASVKSTKMLYSQVISRSSTPQSKKATRPGSVKSERAPSVQEISREPSAQDKEILRPLSDESRTKSAASGKGSTTVSSEQKRAPSTCDEVRLVSAKSARIPSAHDISTPSSSQLKRGQSERESRLVSATSAMHTFRPSSIQGKQESRPVTAASRTPSVMNTSRAASVQGNQESRPVTATLRTPSALHTSRASTHDKQESMPVFGKSRTPSVIQTYRAPSTQSKPESRPVTAEFNTQSAMDTSNTSLTKNEKKSSPVSAEQTRAPTAQDIPRVTYTQIENEQRAVSVTLARTASTQDDISGVPHLKGTKMSRQICTKSKGAKDGISKATPQKCNKKSKSVSTPGKSRSPADKDDTRASSVQGAKKRKQLMDAISTKPLLTRTSSSQGKKESKQGFVQGKRIPLLQNGNGSRADSTEPGKAGCAQDNICEFQSSHSSNDVRPKSTDYEMMPTTQSYKQVQSTRTPSSQRDTKLEVVSTKSLRPQSVKNNISITPWTNQSEKQTESTSTGQLMDVITDEIKPTKTTGVKDGDTEEDKKDIDLVVNGRATNTRENPPDSERKLNTEQSKINEEEYREFVKSLYAKYKPEMSISGTAFPAPGAIEIDTTKHAIDCMEKLKKKDQELFENLKRFKKDDAVVDKLSRELHEANCLLANLEQDIENLKAQKELNMCMLNHIKNEHKCLLDEKYHLQKQLALAKKSSHAQQNKRKSKEFEQLSLAYDKLDHKEKIMRRRIAMLEAKLSLIISKLDTPKSKQDRAAVPPLDLSKLDEKKVLPPLRNAPKAPRKGVNTKSVAEQNFTSFNTGKQHKARTTKPKLSTSTPSMQNEFIKPTGRDNRRPCLPAINSQRALQKPGHLPRSGKQDNFRETAVMHVNFQMKSIQVKPKEDTKAEELRFPDIVKGSQFLDKSKIVPKKAPRKPVQKSKPPFYANIKPSPYFSSPGH